MVKDDVNCYEIVDSSMEIVVVTYDNYFKAQEHLTKMYVGIKAMVEEVDEFMNEAVARAQAYIEEMHIKYKNGMDKIDE